MNTMYEILMSIPLFKGASHDQISLFLEKTSLQFKNFKTDDKVCAYGDDCQYVICLLSGKLRVEHPVAHGKAVVTETIGPGSVVGFGSLFGLNTKFEFDAIALQDSGLMYFSKESYRQLLQSSQIYLINCLNYLSRKGQRCEEVSNALPGCNLKCRLAAVVALTTSNNAADIRIASRGLDLAEVLCCNRDCYEREIELLEQAGYVKRLDPQTLSILSRAQLLQACDEEN